MSGVGFCMGIHVRPDNSVVTIFFNKLGFPEPWFLYHQFDNTKGGDSTIYDDISLILLQ